MDKETPSSSSSLGELSIRYDAMSLILNKTKAKRRSPVPQHSDCSAPLQWHIHLRFLPLPQDRYTSVAHCPGEGSNHEGTLRLRERFSFVDSTLNKQ